MDALFNQTTQPLNHYITAPSDAPQLFRAAAVLNVNGSAGHCARVKVSRSVQPRNRPGSCVMCQRRYFQGKQAPFTVRIRCKISN